MKKRTSSFLFSILLFFLMVGVAFASPIIVYDNYWGADDHNYGDKIEAGNTDHFEIDYAAVSLNGTWLTVDIYTSFAGKGDDGLFRNYTVGSTGIGYGDLFLASEWKPYGSEPYAADNHATGTLWSYAFSLDNRWWDGVNTSWGSGTLYKLNGATNDSNSLLAGDFMTGNAIWRDGQEVAVDTISDSVSALPNSGSWSVHDQYIRFSIDIVGTGLLSGPEIAFHWGQTCGNDVIEGFVPAPVPEPATMLLLGSGLIGLAAVGRRKFFKK